MANLNNDTNSRRGDIVTSNQIHTDPLDSNPMLIGVVLQTLFKYASIEDIQTYRQVCRFWLNESLPLWRRTAWIKISETESRLALNMNSYLDVINGIAKTDPFRFSEYPYKRVVIHKENICKTHNGKLSITQLSFWRNCGPAITHLTIATSKFLSIEEFETILFNYLPNMVYLKLIDVTVSNGLLKDVDRETFRANTPLLSSNNRLKELTIDQVSGSLLPISWLRFLDRFPKIQSLNLSSNEGNLQQHPPGQELINILNAMVTIAREKGILWKLENLNVLLMGKSSGIVLDNRHLGLLRELKLQLTSLCIHIAPETTRSTIRSILQTYSSTLRKLVVYRAGMIIEDINIPIDARNFPYGVTLDALSELWLYGRLLCDNLAFVQFTPNLTSLIMAQDFGNSLHAARYHISGFLTYIKIKDMLSAEVIDQNRHLREGNLSTIEDTDFARLEHVTVTGLKEFVLSGRQESICTADAVAALKRLMPNIKTLMLGLGNDGFRVACEGWKELEELIIEPNEVDQFGLTGNIPLIQHRLPNLSNLTNLRYFGMGHEPGRPSKYDLNENSIIHAILPLEKLNDATLVYHANKVTLEVLLQLTSKFRGCTIYASNDDRRHWLVYDDNPDYSDSNVDDEETTEAETSGSDDGSLSETG